jgi:hypothetical protein
MTNGRQGEAVSVSFRFTGKVSGRRNKKKPKTKRRKVQILYRKGKGKSERSRKIVAARRPRHGPGRHQASQQSIPQVEKNTTYPAHPTPRKQEN